VCVAQRTCSVANTLGVTPSLTSSTAVVVPGIVGSTSRQSLPLQTEVLLLSVAEGTNHTSKASIASTFRSLLTKYHLLPSWECIQFYLRVRYALRTRSLACGSAFLSRFYLLKNAILNAPV
jgi:hypothetical protein